MEWLLFLKYLYQTMHDDDDSYDDYRDTFFNEIL